MPPREDDAKLKGEAFQVIETDTDDIGELIEKLKSGQYVMVVPSKMKSSAEIRMHIHFAHGLDATDLRNYKKLVAEHAKMHEPEWAHSGTRPHLHDPNVTTMKLIEIGAT